MCIRDRNGSVCVRFYTTFFKNKYGFEHPEVAESFELTGVTYIGMEEIEDRAIPYLMESVKIRKKTNKKRKSRRQRLPRKRPSR